MISMVAILLYCTIGIFSNISIFSIMLCIYFSIIIINDCSLHAHYYYYAVHRYKDLKKEGKLNKFMEKKRKKNSNKDHRWMPTRRSDA